MTKYENVTVFFAHRSHNADTTHQQKVRSQLHHHANVILTSNVAGLTKVRYISPVTCNLFSSDQLKIRQTHQLR